MPDEPPSILPRGTGTRCPLSPSPALPGSAVYIQSVAGFRCMAAHATGIEDTAGGRSPASIRATRHAGSSERREAITAPAEPPPMMMKSNCSAMSCLLPVEDEADMEGGLSLPLVRSRDSDSKRAHAPYGLRVSAAEPWMHLSFCLISPYWRDFRAVLPYTHYPCSQGIDDNADLISLPQCTVN